MEDSITIFSIIFFAIMVILAVYGYRHPNAWHHNRNNIIGNNSSLRQADSLSGVEFEHWCADLLKYNGFTNIAVTKASGDQGADIIAFRNAVKYAIQCKRFKNKLGNKPVQEVFTAKAYYNCTSAAVMTTNYFTEGAIDAARRTGVELWDRSVLSRMIDEKRTYLDQQGRVYQQRQSPTYEKALWDRLYSHIRNPYGVAGVMGNFQAESAMKANNLQDSYQGSIGMNDEQYTAAVDNGSYGNFVHDSAGYGYFQATYWSIKEYLLSYARSHGKSIGDGEMQIDCFCQLLKEQYANVWGTLVNRTGNPCRVGNRKTATV